MSGRFKNSRSRLERAAYHTTNFIAEWAALLKDKELPTVGRYDKKSGWFIVSLNPSPELIERIRVNTLSLEIGELAYQLRAALDGLIWDAVTIMQGGTEPPSDATSLEFPILNGKDRNFAKCGLNNFPFPNDLKKWIESIQPDTAEKPVGDPDRGLNNALEDIHDVARLDRHRRPRVVASPITEVGYRVVWTPTANIIADELIDSCDLFSGKYEFLRLRAITAAGKMPEHCLLQTRTTAEVVAEGIQLYDGEDIGKQLERFIHAVERVIVRFEAEPELS
jgi:hypothetical protein